MQIESVIKIFAARAFGVRASFFCSSNIAGRMPALHGYGLLAQGGRVVGGVVDLDSDAEAVFDAAI